MSDTRALRLVASVLLGAAVASCGSDSTRPPNEPTPAQLAGHFDSLYVASVAARQSDGDYFSRRANDIAFFEVPAALGVLPAALSISIGGNTESWHAFASAQDITYDGGVRDTAYWVAAYKDDALSEFLIARIEGGEAISVYFGADTGEAHVLSAPFTMTTASSDGSCAAPPVLVSPQVPGTVPVPCALSTFDVSLSLSFPAGTEGQPATTVSIADGVLHGLQYRTFDTTNTSGRVVGRSATLR